MYKVTPNKDIKAGMVVVGLRHSRIIVEVSFQTCKKYKQVKHTNKNIKKKSVKILMYSLKNGILRDIPRYH